MYTGMMLGFAVLLVMLNGLFVAAEFAFVKVRRTRLELRASAGSAAARSALFGVRHLDAYLSVCQLGITLSSLGLGWIGEPAVASVLRPLLELCAAGNPALVSTLSVVIGFSIITFMHVVFGELAPKSMSIQRAEPTVMILARPIRFFYVLCFPVVSLMNGISNLFLRMAGVAPASESEQSHSPEELRMLITDSSNHGHLKKDEGNMLDNIFSFYQKTAKDVMQHRIDTIALDSLFPLRKALEFVRESGHTRYPVYEGSRDNIIGFVHVRDLLLCEGAACIRPLIRIPFYAPETLPLETILRGMQGDKQQFCVVLDEYGIWQGVLTMEDIVESIVGDIQDEFDNEEPDAIALPDGAWSVSGNLSLDDLAEHMPLGRDAGTADMYKILAAHFIETLDRIPRQGDAIELCGTRMTVMAMERNRVRRIRVERMPDDPDAAD